LSREDLLGLSHSKKTQTRFDFLLDIKHLIGLWMKNQ